MLFIESVWDAAQNFFSGEQIDKPEIRVSHIIKGRIQRQYTSLQTNF